MGTAGLHFTKPGEMQMPVKVVHGAHIFPCEYVTNRQYRQNWKKLL